MATKHLAVLGIVSLVVTGAQNTKDADRNWPFPYADQGSTRYSPLKQIDTSNVQRLTRAWTFHTGSGRFASPPMAVDNVIYFSAPNGVFAIDAVTGTQIWKYGPATETTTAPAPGGRGGGSNTAGTAVRGPTYWPGAAGIGPRIYSSISEGLAAIDAKTGTLVKTFGRNGVLPGLWYNSPPVIYKNFLITRGDQEGVKGNTLKAYDVITGEPRWTFYLKAQPGDPNRATWLNGSADTEVTPGLWGMFSIDEERGLLFVPVEKIEGNGANDYFGGANPGNNLYSDSLVALDATTGKMKWFQQLVHHDIWDYDIAAAPVLIDVRRNGRTIPAVAQSTKMSLLFIFHRETGEPIFGMEERPVPQTTVPGEWTAPTQPFPLKPAPLSRTTFTKSELAKVTPEHQAFCEQFWETNKLSDAVPYAAWKLGENILLFPGAQGGSNWWGVTFNKPLGLIIGNVHTAGQWGRLEPGGGRGGRRGAGARGNQDPGEGAGRANAETSPTAPLRYSKTPSPFNRFWNNANMWSCTEPPWGELVAVNANTGDIAWRVPLGEFEELTAKGVKPTGTPASGGAITTAGNLVFIGATIDGYFRAFDARNGKELWRDKLPFPSQGIPSTYMGRDGKQYVVVGANGGGFFGAPTGDDVIAYTVR
jgi:glucose dehydrogenase